MGRAIVSIDGACSGHRATCAAVVSADGAFVSEVSRHLPEVDGYTLAAEIAGIALAGKLIERAGGFERVTIETDNPNVPRVIDGSYRPKQFSRIPPRLLEAARELCRAWQATFVVLPRNATAGLRRADRLASAHLWRRRS
jgi:ribonuclease HI